MPGWIGSNWSIQPSSQLSLLLGAENIEVGLADVVLVDVGAQLPLLPHDTCTGVAKDGTTDGGNAAQFHLQARGIAEEKKPHFRGFLPQPEGRQVLQGKVQT